MTHWHCGTSRWELRLLDLSHQITGGHGLVSDGGLSKLTVTGWVNRSSGEQ